MPRRRLLLRFAAALPLLAGLAAGCDGLSPAPFEPQVVVRAMLTAGEPLPNINLSESGRFDEPDGPAIENAEVRIELLTEAGGVEATYVYAHRRDGSYRPVSEERPEVLSGGTYRLVAEVPGSGTVRAETTVPTPFEVVRPPADTIRYQVDPQPTFDVTPSAYPGREAVYVFTVEALEPDPDQLTPLASVLFENGTLDMDDLVLGNSPLLGAENYERNPDGTLALRIPWLLINFYGPHRFEVTALDDALVAFIQSQALQFNPSTLSPGEIPSVVSNVENGAGVFGSIAHAETAAYVARP